MFKSLHVCYLINTFYAGANRLSVCAARGAPTVTFTMPSGQSFQEGSSLSFLKSGVVPGCVMRKALERAPPP